MAQLGGNPRRRFYDGRNVERAVTAEDLRAMTHRRLPRFALEYLEGGAEEESSLARDRAAYADWRFMPRQLVDVSGRTLATTVLGRPAPVPLVIAPTGLNGLFMQGADLALAQAAADSGVPFVQSTMSNERMEDVARTANLRHWWQLYVFGGDDVWQDLVRRAHACGCEALVLTTNAQIFGNREWSTRTMATKTRPSLSTMIDAALHPQWIKSTLMHGMPEFSNVLDYVPKGRRGFFETAFWIREHQPTSMDWKTVARIRGRWSRPFFLKGILNADDVRRALDAGVDGIVLGTHGGRQLDSCISGLDLLPQAAQIVQGRIELHVSGGLRRGTDLLKALALGADAVMAGRAPLYGLCAGGRAGVRRALDIIAKEALDAMGLLGVRDVGELGPQLLSHLGPNEATTRSRSLS
jgi:(S)-mandelate dehydrogenase